jgi:hypothetical protein
MLKRSVYLTLILATLAATMRAGSPPQLQKSSATDRYDAAAEVKTYYAALLETDANVKQQFDSLAKKSSLYGDVHFGPGEPQVVSWYPTQNEFTAGADFHFNERFLVIQPLTFGRPRLHESDSAVVSEFHVIHDGRTRIDDKDREKEPQLVTNTIKIEFLGFRSFQLSETR